MVCAFLLIKIKTEIRHKKMSIIRRREIEPMLAKATQLLNFYEEAMSCSSTIWDRSGQAIKTPKFEKLKRFCEFCKESHDCPCEKIHADAVTESRLADETYIYTCAAGFAYWTSPLYRNGRYAGALTAGRVLLYPRKEAIRKFHTRCNDRLVTEKFDRMLEDVAEKEHDEIQAMARLLGVCAEEISEKGGERSKVLRHIAWHEEIPKKQNEMKKIPTRKTTSTEETAEEANPLEKERMLIAAFQRGDKDTGFRLLNELINLIISICPDNFEIIRFKAIELMVLLSREAVSASDDDLIENCNRFLKRMQESKTTEELIQNLHLSASHMAGKIFSFTGVLHASVLRKAQRYIWENYTRKISLEEISKASGLSAPYFSSIFKEEMGENFSNYLNRLRIERAAALLTETGKPLKTIAELCGFEDQSWFSKVFKSFTGVSPGKYRETGRMKLGDKEDE